MPSLRDRAENVIRRWHKLELDLNGDPIIDYDCATEIDPGTPYSNRFTVLAELHSLRHEARGSSPLTMTLDAHSTYLTAVLGEQLSLSQYVLRTQGCPATGWSAAYIEYRGELARAALTKLGITWDTDSLTRLRELERKIPAADAGDVIRQYASNAQKSVGELTGAQAEFQLTIETVKRESYWSYWLDGAGQTARLRINITNATFTEVEAYRFALHEILGHAWQYANLAEIARTQEVDWPRLFSIHCPHQVMFEGLAQVLPLVTRPDDDMVEARTRLDHYQQLVRAELHLMVNRGTSVIDCRDYVRQRLPFWTDASTSSALIDRSRHPQLRSYLWAYPAGIDWFVNLYETDGTLFQEILRDAYQQPLSPSELQQRWPSGPAIGGNYV